MFKAPNEVIDWERASTGAGSSTDSFKLTRMDLPLVLARSAPALQLDPWAWEEDGGGSTIGGVTVAREARRRSTASMDWWLYGSWTCRVLLKAVSSAPSQLLLRVRRRAGEKDGAAPCSEEVVGDMVDVAAMPSRKRCSGGRLAGHE